MGCSWSLTYDNYEIDSGNQNCDLRFLSLLLKNDFQNHDQKMCIVPGKTMIKRLEVIGYSNIACDTYMRNYRKQIKEHENDILFIGPDFTYVRQDKAFWEKVQRITYNDISRIWKMYLSENELEQTDRCILDLITNSFDSEYIEPYFDQMVNYYIIAQNGSEEGAFALDCTEVIEWGYWKIEDFERDEYDYLVERLAGESVLVRHSLYEYEEDTTHEFKEIKGKNPVSSIKDNVEKYVLSFVNSKGGEIVWGISDSRIIVGFEANAHTRDEIRRNVISTINNIIPQIDPRMYSMDFISLVENGQVLQDIVCFKIKVKKKRIKELYHNAKKISWIRQNGASVEVEI